MRRHDALAGMDADIGGEISRRGDNRVDGVLTGATLHHRPAGKGRDKRLLAQLNQGSLDIGIEEEW